VPIYKNEQAVEGENCPVCGDRLYTADNMTNVYCKRYHTRQQQLECVIEQLQTANAELKDKLAVATEALEHYAEITTWKCSLCSFNRHRRETPDPRYDLIGEENGYRIAQQALAKVNGGENSKQGE
jgi:hypothetical protein